MTTRKTHFFREHCELHWFEETIDNFNGFQETIGHFNGFEQTIGNFQWFLKQPSPLNVFWQSDHCHQWFFNGFWSCYHRFQWFSMVLDHWSNDAMVSMDRYGLVLSSSNLLEVGQCLILPKLNFVNDCNGVSYGGWQMCPPLFCVWAPLVSPGDPDPHPPLINCALGHFSSYCISQIWPTVFL